MYWVGEYLDRVVKKAYAEKNAVKYIAEINVGMFTELEI